MKFQLDRAKQSTKFINHDPIMNCASPRATGECVYFAGFTPAGPDPLWNFPKGAMDFFFFCDGGSLPLFGKFKKRGPPCPDLCPSPSI